MPNFKTWLLGVAAAGIAGGANGVITGFAAVGIDPEHFNLRAGLHSTLTIAGISALMSSIIGVAAYLKQSPLPNESEPVPHASGRGEREDRDDHEGHSRINAFTIIRLRAFYSGLAHSQIFAARQRIGAFPRAAQTTSVRVREPQRYRLALESVFGHLIEDRSFAAPAFRQAAQDDYRIFFSANRGGAFRLCKPWSCVSLSKIVALCSLCEV